MSEEGEYFLTTHLMAERHAIDVFSVVAILNTMSINLTVRQKLKGRRVTVEMDADRLERLAAGFGFLHPDFIERL